MSAFISLTRIGTCTILSLSLYTMGCAVRNRGEQAEAKSPKTTTCTVALFAPYYEPEATVSLTRALTADSPNVSIRAARTIVETMESGADVLMIVMNEDAFNNLGTYSVENLKNRKVIGVGYGAAKLYGELGLEIYWGACAHGTTGPPRLSVQENKLVKGDSVESPFFVFEPATLDPDNFHNELFFGMYIGDKKPRRRDLVDVIAIQPQNHDYAPVVRQSTHVLICVDAPADKWSQSFQRFVRQLTLGLNSLDINERRDLKGSGEQATESLGEGGQPNSRLAKFDSLEAECQQAIQEFWAKVRAAQTDEEREELFADAPKPDKLPKFWEILDAKYFEFVEADSQGDAAALVLAFIISNSSSEPDTARAMDLLLRDHFKSGLIGDLCLNLGWTERPNGQRVLEKILAENPHRDVRAKACFALGTLAKDTQDIAAEQLFDRCVSEFGDVPVYRGAARPTLGELATEALFPIRNLAIGKTVPEIEGNDSDGVPFKLSDYRGKVVVLDFWGFW